MRFEKLNENKIKITLTNQDLKSKNIDFHSFMANPIESQDLFFDMLNEAEKEIGFSTKNYTIRLEALQVPTGDFILIITRSLPETKKCYEKKKILIKRKKPNITNSQAIYCFSDFDDFCCFCNSLHNTNIQVSNLAKNICLYEYHSMYYLVFTNINLNHSNLKKVFSLITEFGTYVSDTSLFKSILAENGKILMKNNAIKTSIQYFK